MKFDDFSQVIEVASKRIFLAKKTALDNIPQFLKEYYPSNLLKFSD